MGCATNGRRVPTADERDAVSEIAALHQAPRTAIAKIWDEHLVDEDLIFCDLHLVQEVSSPQAFDELRLGGHGDQLLKELGRLGRYQ